MNLCARIPRIRLAVGFYLASIVLADRAPTDWLVRVLPACSSLSTCAVEAASGTFRAFARGASPKIDRRGRKIVRGVGTAVLREVLGIRVFLGRTDKPFHPIIVHVVEVDQRLVIPAP